MLKVGTLILSCIVLFKTGACQTSSMFRGLPAVQADLTQNLVIKGKSFEIEIAATPASIQRGLMFRTALRENQGMLFVFPEETHVSFWMKNTLISLDIIFLDKDGKVIKIYSRAEPLSLQSLPCPTKAKAALEVTGGTAESLQLKPGDLITHDIFPDRDTNPAP